MKYILLVGIVMINIIGQTLLKFGTSLLKTEASGTFIQTIGMYVTSPYIMGGLFLYGFGAFLWIYALSKFPLSYAYPFLSTGYIFIVLISAFIFHEQITATKIISIVLITIGVMLLGV